MFDIPLRPFKDSLINPLTTLIPTFTSPTHITALAFTSGLLSTLSISTSHSYPSLAFWLLNRILDGLDGSLARARNQTSDLGGFLDLLGDFIVYSLIPISCAASREARVGEVWHLWASVAVVEASFHVNNFVLFFGAAILEKRKAMSSVREKQGKIEELTSVMMRPALVEGFESAVLFTGMLAFPMYTEILCWTMAVLVSVGIVQRVMWLIPVLQ